jgi:CBS domain-containing protein
MVSRVITARPEEHVRDVAARLLQNRISALPVVDEAGKVVGIISEGDLMRRSETGTALHRSWWLALFAGSEELAKDFVRANAQRVADVMTHPVITAAPDTNLGEIASLLESKGIKRVPVVDQGRLVGIVSRANLLQALAKASQETATVFGAGDAEVRQRILDRLQGQGWTPWLLNVTARDGVVDLWGVASSEAEKKAARIAAESTPGVRTVNDNVMVKASLMDT